MTSRFISISSRLNEASGVSLCQKISVSNRYQLRLTPKLTYDVVLPTVPGVRCCYVICYVTVFSLGYQGVFIARNTSDYCEGEATFFRTSRFSLMSSESLLLSDIINQVGSSQTLS